MPANSRLNLPRLAFANLRAKPYRSLGLILVVGMFSFVMFGGSLLSGSVRRGMDSMARRLGADLMVVPKGYDAKLQAALLRGEPSSFYLRDDLAEKLRRIPGVAKAAPQLYLATLDDPCCTYPIQIIGYDPDNDFTIPPWMQANSLVTPTADEIVVGNLITSPVGTKSFFFGDIFRVAARLDRTGMGFDTSVFMPIKTAGGLLRKRQSATLENIPDGSVSAVLISLEPGRNPLQIIGEIRKRLSGDYNLDYVVAKDMISDISSRLDGLTIPLFLTTAFFWIGAVGVLFLFFSVLTGERKRELALLRVFGASLKRVNRLVLCEALLLSGGGAIAGLVLAAILLLPFQNLILKTIGLPYLTLTPGGVLLLAASAVLTALAIGPLASLYAVLRNGRQEIYASLRSGE